MPGLHVLVGALPPPFGWRQLGATHIDFGWVLIGLAAVLYALGVRRLRRLEPDHPWSGKRVVAFYVGLAVTFVAVQMVIGVYDQVLLSDHMAQHLLLIMVAAPFFAMGAPVELLERSTSGRAQQLVRRALSSKVADVVGHPIAAFALYAITIPVAHLTSFYNLTLTNEPVHDLEHLLFLVVGYLFWRHVVAIEPTRHPLHPGLRLLYLALAVPVDTFTGVVLATSTHELFPAYVAMHRSWGPSLLSDLHTGGAIMWLGGDGFMVLAMVPVAAQWVRYEEAKTAELDRRLDMEEEEARRLEMEQARRLDVEHADMEHAGNRSEPPAPGFEPGAVDPNSFVGRAPTSPGGGA